MLESQDSKPNDGHRECTATVRMETPKATEAGLKAPQWHFERRELPRMEIGMPGATAVTFLEELKGVALSSSIAV